LKKNIKLFDPVIGTEEEKTIIKVLNSGFWASGSGTGKVGEFENQFKQYVNSNDCIAVNSGTSALNLALSLFNLKNKEVLLPSLSFVSTAHSIVLNGAKPVFLEVNPKTLCIEPETIQKAITKKTGAVLPVHFGGLPCKITEINDICKENKIHLIEDAAHASGSFYKNKKIGNHGSAVCFSFHPVKNLAMPTGGLISLNHSNHKTLRKTLESRRWCGITNRKNVNYDVKEMGWNYYMNEFSAAIGLIQLKKLDKLNKMRYNICKMYHDKINTDKKMPLISGSSYHFYWILVKNQKKFRQNMSNSKIETGIHYKPIHSMSMYKQKKKLPLTEKISNSIVTLPTSPNLKKSQIEFIIQSINKFI